MNARRGGLSTKMCSLPKECTDRGEFFVHIYSIQEAGLDNLKEVHLEVHLEREQE